MKVRWPFARRGRSRTEREQAQAPESIKTLLASHSDKLTLLERDFLRRHRGQPMISLGNARMIGNLLIEVPQRSEAWADAVRLARRGYPDSA